MKQLLLFCLLIIIASSCSQRHGADFTRKTLSFSLDDDLKTLDPATAYDTAGMDVLPLVLESLYQYSYVKDPLELEPLLADGMPVFSGDHKTVTVKIKKGVLWQDGDFFPGGKGRELVAADFLYAWKRLALPELQSPGTWIFNGKVQGWDAFREAMHAAKEPNSLLQAPIDGLAATDEHTLVIHLLHPYPQLTHILAMAYTAPLPHEVFDKGGTFALNEKLVGTGPFRFREYVRSSHVTLERNPTYHGEKYPLGGDEAARRAGLLDAAGKPLPFTEEVTFRIFKETQPRWLEFRRGNLDVSGIPKDNFAEVVSQGEIRPEMKALGIQFQKLEQASLVYLVFNMRDTVLGGNVNLRRAISCAIDRDDFIEKFRNGRGAKATSLVPRILPGHSGRATFAYDYSLGQARAYLVKAGYPDGKGLAPLRFDLTGSATGDRQQGEFVKESLAKIGVQVNVVSNTFPAYLEKERNGNLQFVISRWDTEYPDAENVLALLYGKNVSPGPNLAHYQNPAYDRLFEKIAPMAPSPERSALIRQAEDLVYQDLPVAPMFYPFAYSVGHGWVKNFRPNIQVINHMKYFDVDLAAKKALQPKL